jgi:hypothetical protein
MRRVGMLLAGAFVATATVVSVSTPAFAVNSPGSATPGHFTYGDPVFGIVSCNEVHHPTNNLPSNFPAGATTKGGYDTITCNIAIPNHAGLRFTNYWFSDFGIEQNVGFAQESVDDTGAAYHAIAWYPNG